jgi:zeta-carotene desaturase
VSALVIDDGSSLAAEHFISTLPFDRLAKVAPASMVRDDRRLERLDELTCSPIIGIHLWLECSRDQPVFTLPHLSFMQSPLHWIFNKGYDEQAGGQHLHGVISAAHDLVEQPADKLALMALEELRRVTPAALAARLLHSRVVKEKRATFSASPGVDRLRPTTRGAIANLYLAGDWCNTGWPATMEGAARSGYLAAAAVMDDAGVTDHDRARLTTQGLAPDLQPTQLYRLLAGR